MKIILAYFFYFTGISYLIFKLNNLFWDIRVINYHCTPLQDVLNFEKQLKFYKKHYNNVNLNDLNNLFKFNYKKANRNPGIIISFDDGLRSNFDFALPLLEKYGFTGWFFIPVEFIENPTYKFAINHSINIKQMYLDERFSMNKEELRLLSFKHVLGSHTFSHHRILESDNDKQLINEIYISKNNLEDILGKPIELFCWVGGELEHYTTNAQKIIKKSNYIFSFTTNNLMINSLSDPHNLNRTNIESNNKIPIVLFQLSGIMDLLYYRKRKLVKKKLAI